MQSLIENAILDGTQKYPPLSEVRDTKDLVPYLEMIQVWLLRSPISKMESLLLRPYYETFTELAKQTDPAKVNIGYIREKLTIIEAEEDINTYDDVLRCLSDHVDRIYRAEFENPQYAELITRVFFVVMQERGENISQVQLSRAKAVLLPLWEQCRFERLYIQ